MTNFSSFWSDLEAPKEGRTPRIAFTDATDSRILHAVNEIIKKKLAHPLLVGNPEKISAACASAGLKEPEPDTVVGPPQGTEKEKLAQILLEKQKKLHLTIDEALRQLEDPLYQGIGMLLDNRVDGLIGGCTRPTSDIVRAAIQCVGPGTGQHLISGHFLIESQNRSTGDQTPFLFADCAVVPEPSPRALAAIALGAAEAYRFFTGQAARVALLSFSTRGSAQHPLVDRIKEALSIIKKQDPSIVVDGELQVDAVLDLKVAKIKKAEDSPVAGRANVLVFPTLEAGNIGYKLVQRFSNSRIAGPLLWGLKKPMSDLSRGCTVQEITDTTLCVSAMIRGLN